MTSPPAWLTMLVLAVVLAGCAGSSPAARPIAGQAGSAAPAPSREVLPNGVVLIHQEHRAADVVALQLWMRIGGRDEAPEELGLTHYMEHMLFKGTPTRPLGSIDALIEGLGGTSNAFTAYDYTHYDMVVPAAHLRTAAEVLADIAVNASFDARELEREKKVVFEEMSLTEDDPERFLVRRLSEVAYAQHPYGRPVLGTRQLVADLTRDRLNAYYRKYYVPRSMTLVVVGAVGPEEVRAAVAATFGRLDGPAPSRPPVAAVPTLAGGRREDIARPERQAYLGMAWHAAATRAAPDDIFAVDLLTYILGDGPSSRLNQTVRERLGLVSHIESSYIVREQSGIVSVTARLDPANLEAAERAILDVVRRIQSEGVTEAERERALVTAESFYAFDIETAEGLARTYGQAEVTWTLADELRYLDRLRQVTASQIQAAARTYLAADRVARVRFIPEARR
jgi:predicted Zn-dependent peptidase